MRISDLIADEIGQLRLTLSIIDQHTRRPVELKALSRLLARLADFNEDLQTEFPRLTCRPDANR